MKEDPILLVEDNPRDAAFTVQALTENHIANDIVVATSSEEALGLLFPEGGASALRPAIVLLDAGLPQAGGTEVLRRVREDPRTGLLPVIVLAASSEDAGIAGSGPPGADSFVSKPVVFSDFLHAAGVLGVRWLAVSEAAPAR